MKFSIILTIAFLFSGYQSIAQNKYVVKANLAYASENYSEAAELCAQAYTKLSRKGKAAKKLKADMAFKTAESFRQTEHFREANEWYDRTILLEYYNTNPEVYLYNGDMLQMMAEQEKAIKSYDLYLALVPGA